MIHKRAIPPVILMLLIFFLFSPFPHCRGEESNVTVSPGVMQYLETAQFVPIIAVLADKAPPGRENTDREKAAHPASAGSVAAELQEANEAALSAILPLLEEETARGNLRDYNPLWLINAFSAQVNSEGLSRLCRAPQIKTICLDQKRHYLSADIPQPFSAVDKQAAGPEGIFLEKPPGGGKDFYNLRAINVPPLWEEGCFGQGVVVAIMDTGVDLDHEDLKQNYRGNLPGCSHGDSWFDATGTLTAEAPIDTHGHGTHIAGIILGGNKEKPLGIAPEARWIAVNIFSDGYAWDSHIAQAFQWLLAPGGDPAKAPHIINCSWASRPEFAEEFLHWEILYNLEKAGILVVFAAGNNGEEGPGSPASYPHSFSVGALKQAGDHLTIADFSSRGPVHWQDLSYIKPELVAPGVKIVSTWPDNSYAALDGTSTAAAHLSGAAALLLQAKPGLSPTEIKYLFKSTAVWDPLWDEHGQRPNNLYGYGLLDTYAAVKDEPLIPAELLFFDGAEQGIANWKTSPQNPWKITRELVSSGSFSFADSPWEEYKNKTTSWIALAKPVSLEGYHSPILSFRHFYDLRQSGEKKDWAYVDISFDGINWSSLYHFSGSNDKFEHFYAPISYPEEAKTLYFRFRLQSNDNGPGKGWYIDDIALSAFPLPLRALDRLRLAPERTRISQGEKILVRADALFSTHTLKEIGPEKILWHSSNPASVQVNNGEVTGLAPGESIIKGTFYGKSAEFKVVVIDVQAATPHPPPGTYINAAEVTLGPDAPGLKITYTLDGSDPDQKSAVYEKPIAIDKTSILKARTYLEAIPGPIAEFFYTITEGAYISGIVHTEGKPLSGKKTTLVFTSPDGKKSYPVTSLAVDGSFSLDLPLGSYLLSAGCEQHLTTVLRVQVNKKAPLNLGLIKLRAGDLNNDNKIDLTDLTILSLAYHSRPGEKNWNPPADLNGDGLIDTQDLNMLLQNYGARGDSAP